MKPAIGPVSWVGALILAALLHAVLALVFVLAPSQGVAEAPGLGGIQIALGPKGGAPGSEPQADADTPAEEAPAEAEPLPPEPEPLPPEPVPQPPPPDPAPLPTPVPDAVPVEAVRAVAPTHAPVSNIAEDARPTPRPAPSARQAGVGGQGGPEDSPDAGDRGPDITAGGVAGTDADYATILLAWLQHHKRYPRRAESRRQEGVVRLFIALDRDGQVLEGRIDRGAGYPLLDKAALDMLDRAAPLPPVPDDIPGNRIEIIVPVHFFMQE